MAKDFKKLDNVLQTFADNQSVPGCGAVVMQGDEVIYEGYKGYADIASKKPVEASTIFRQASTTKLLTYAVMGQLFEEGKYLMSDPLYDYLPEWKNAKKYQVMPSGQVIAVPLENPITIGDAVGMMCGMPYCMGINPNATTPTQAAMSRVMAKLTEGRDTDVMLRDEVRAMSEAPVQFEPGTHWQYGYGSEIMGALVEEMTGKKVFEAVKERIIDPLGMKDTGVFIDDNNRDQIVTAYRKTPEGKLEAIGPEFDEAYNEKKHPIGTRMNLLSTPRDFAIFMQMLANGGTYKGERFLAPGTVEMLHTNRLHEAAMTDFMNDGHHYFEGYGYGFGFRTVITKQYGHNGHLGCFGWTGGYGTWAEADPVDKLSIVYMHNMMPNEELYHHLRVRAAAYGCME